MLAGYIVGFEGKTPVCIGCHILLLSAGTRAPSHKTPIDRDGSEQFQCKVCLKDFSGSVSDKYLQQIVTPEWVSTQS